MVFGFLAVFFTGFPVSLTGRKNAKSCYIPPYKSSMRTTREIKHLFARLRVQLTKAIKKFKGTNKMKNYFSYAGF
jgi:hypothetical protein